MKNKYLSTTVSFTLFVNYLTFIFTISDLMIGMFLDPACAAVYRYLPTIVIL